MNKMKAVLLAMTISLGGVTYGSQRMNSINEIIPSESTDKESIITFKKGKVIEIAYATVQGGKEMQLNEYFGKVLPIASKYGGKMLGSFEVTAIIEGEIHPQMVALFEWPNIEAYNKISKDKEAMKIFPLRDEVITSFKQGFFTVEKDVDVTFTEGKRYEFFNAWLTPNAKELLPKYFEGTAEVKKLYGSPKFLVDLKPLANAPTESYSINPHMCGIVEWTNTSAYYGLIADEEFKKSALLLEKALSKMYMIHTKFNFPQ